MIKKLMNTKVIKSYSIERLNKEELLEIEYIKKSSIKPKE